jgi:hypothetical protein
VPVQVNESRLAEDLDQTWEVLAEPIQTVRHLFSSVYFPLNSVLVAVRKCLLCAHQACITLLLLLFVGDAKIWNT